MKKSTRSNPIFCNKCDIKHVFICILQLVKIMPNCCGAPDCEQETPVPFIDTDQGFTKDLNKRYIYILTKSKQ